ncbi:hypothetical protein [Sphingobacterium wenxiniae]|uniref:Lipoprotein n=1 Tax=Sphingobacterium wenxiniae TaxID=683125 RepID=A0A1I6RYR4_9SPHI|nr:hypothetical protein [Sphingobacterium wenxiniae]SFS69853.1 hypothetical protein SAMN05660206_10429 [Sphingobacterium wenxiniae]
MTHKAFFVACFFALFLGSLIFTSCDKSDSYAVLSERAHQKFLEIKALSEQNSCADMDKLSIKKVPYSCGHYFAIHENQISTFEKLTKEYLALQAEADNAKDRPIIYYYSPCVPYPPLEIICENGKAKLLYPYEIQDIEKLSTAIEKSWESLKHFYDAVPCTNASDWRTQAILTGCCYEALAVHKTIRTDEFIEKTYLHTNLVGMKRMLEKTECSTVYCNNSFKEVKCVDGRPTVERQE